MNYLQDPSETLTIQQVSERSEVSRHTLRFWEKKLETVLVPLRTKGGQRRYALEHLLVIEEIKRLKREGLSLPEIHKHFNHGRDREIENPNSQHVDMLVNKVTEIVKSALYSFFEENNTPKKLK